MNSRCYFYLAVVGCLAAHAGAQNLDTQPAFMQIVTNQTIEYRPVVVTNFVAVTNSVVATNFYNAQGILLQPVPPAKPPLPGLIPIPKPTPPAPDPAVVKARQAEAVRDLLTVGLLGTSNQVCVAGGFTSNATQQIQIPQGVTAFDPKIGQRLVTAMNVTAEKAAPATLALLLKSAGQFQTDNPSAILRAASHAGTRAFLAANKEALLPQVIALVQRAGEEAKLREAYNKVMLKGGGLLGSVLGSGPSVDIDTHVADGLWQAFTMQLAAQEAMIRAEPSAHKTPALKEAFGK
jgi:hypothetical protein